MNLLAATSFLIEDTERRDLERVFPVGESSGEEEQMRRGRGLSMLCPIKIQFFSAAVLGGGRSLGHSHSISSSGR